MPRTFQNINLMPATANEIKNMFTSLIQKYSCGCDDISTKLIKTCTDYVFLKVISAINE
jgi:hypothetical protein